MSVRDLARAPLLCPPPPLQWLPPGALRTLDGVSKKEWLDLASSAYPKSKLNQHLEAEP